MLRKDSVRSAIVVLSLLLVCGPAAARPGAAPELIRLEPPGVPDSGGGERLDTLFLFAASGSGSYGSPGTDARGFTFDHAGGPAEAGWFGVDLSASGGDWWHVATTAISAGTGTDMSEALPFDAGDTVNDYALWCGRENVCSWADPDGYGHNWDEHAVLELRSHVVQDSLRLEFAYRSDFEGDAYDWFEVRAWVEGEWVVVYQDDTTADRTFRELGITLSAAEIGGPGTGTRLSFRFTSDAAWDDEDNYFDSDIGAVWLDNLVVSIDGDVVWSADFEDGLEPDGLSFESPDGAGSHAELYRNLFQEDLCIVNSSHAWAFFDLATCDNCDWVIPYGPPYVNEVIEGPLLEVDQHGDPLVVTPERSFWISVFTYFDMPYNALVFLNPPQVAAWRQEDGCLGTWEYDSTVYYYDLFGWHDNLRPLDAEIAESAQGSTVTGLKLRAGGVRDMCGVWCDVYGDGSGHGMAPYLDNIRVFSVEASPAEWSYAGYRRFQDSFLYDPHVRIDSAIDVQPFSSEFLVVGDSAVVELDMTASGGIAASVNGSAGEPRPELYLHWRVVAGPHAGIVEAAQADPGDMDGIWSPWTGSGDFYGETWGSMQADTARVGVSVASDKFAFDFHDGYFEPGDVIEYFFRAESTTGTVSTLPRWALSGDPDLREAFTMRCLPTAGVGMLMVEDGPDLHHHWREALRYNGYIADTYVTQAPGTGTNNGLGCRVWMGGLEPYEAIVWDSGSLPAYTLNAPGGDQICDDVTVLAHWLDQTPHRVGLWVLGNEVASDMAGASFLAQGLGAERVAPGSDYDDRTDIIVPRVYATHPELETLGQTPHFWLRAGCPNIESLDLVAPVGGLAEITHEWEVDPGYGAVAGIYNQDPDGDGTLLNAAGAESRSVFNPWSYNLVMNDGFGIGNGFDYAKLLVGHVLVNLLGHAPEATPLWAGDLPPRTRLEGAFPNPFNPTTTLRCALALAGPASLRVYDLAGRRLRTLHDGPLAAGSHEFEWDGRDDSGHRLASGVYLLRFAADGVQETDKLVLLK